jgi:polyhydroxyalkanoic acid synthase PhaR subunit
MTQNTRPASDIADPFAAWREWLATSERQWNTFLNDAMGTEEFSRSMGQFMDVYLNMQKSMSEGMGRYFTALNVPSRNDVLSLGERLTGIENQLASISVRLDALAAATAANVASPETPASNNAAPAATRPPRTKKPAPKKES